MKEEQLSFTDDEEGFPLGWDKSPGKGLHKAASWHTSVVRGVVAEWIAKRRERYAGTQLVYADAITEAIMPVYRNLPPQLAKLLSEISECYHVGISAKDLAAHCFVSPNSCTAQLGRLRDVGLVKRLESGLHVMPTTDVLLVFAIRCDHRRFGRYWRKINYQDGPKVVSDFINMAHREVSS